MSYTDVLSCIGMVTVMVVCKIESDVIHTSSAPWSHLTGGTSRSRSVPPAYACLAHAQAASSCKSFGLMFFFLTISYAAAFGAASYATPPLHNLDALSPPPMLLVPACRTAPELFATPSAYLLDE